MKRALHMAARAAVYARLLDYAAIGWSVSPSAGPPSFFFFFILPVAMFQNLLLQCMDRVTTNKGHAVVESFFHSK